MAQKKLRSFLQVLILFGIGILLVWLSLRQVAPQKDNILNAFQNANYFWVAVSLGISWLSHFFRALRWNDLLIPTGHCTKLVNSVGHVFVGYLVNYGIPRMGEISRCTMASKYDKVPFEIGFGTVVTERIVDFVLFLIIFFITLAIQFKDLIGLANELVFDKLSARLHALSGEPVQIFILCLVIAILIGLFFLFRKKFSGLMKGKLGNILRGMAEGLGSIRKMKNPVRFILLSFAIWTCYFYSLYTCFFAIEGTNLLTQGQGLTLLLFGTFGVIFSPGGLGAYPLILFGILTNTYGVDEVSAFAMPWLAWTSQFILVLIFGLLSFILLPLYNAKTNVSRAAKA